MKALCIASCHLIASGHGSIYEPVREINDHKMYRNGDFSVVKFAEKYYMVLWKNVIIGEFVGPNRELCDRLVSRKEPDKKDCMAHYNYKNALSEIEEAPKWAEKYHFTIE